MLWDRQKALQETNVPVFCCSLDFRWEPVGLIGCIQPNQTYWIVLLNILSPSLYQFSTKLAWSTRDVAARWVEGEKGEEVGGAGLLWLHFSPPSQ